MKKILLALIVGACTLFSYQASNAQNVMNKGTNIVNLGIGAYFAGGQSLTLTGAYDHGVIDDLFDSKSSLSVGATGAFAVWKHGSSIFAGPRAAVHYHFIPKLDTYVALTLGYSYHFYTHSGPNATLLENFGGFGWGLSLGARYMFTPTLGGFVELGHGLSNMRVGAAFSF